MEREEAINLIKQVLPCLNIDEKIREGFVTLIPELKESEDERIRKEAISIVQSYMNICDEEGNPCLSGYKVLAYLEKQKEKPTNYEREQTEELSTRLNCVMQEYVKAGKDEEEQEHRLKCYQLFWDALEDSEFFEQFKQKEQKPSTPKYRVGDVMRTKQEAVEGITDGLPVIVSVDEDYYYCTNEKIPISEQEEYEFPPMNMRQKSAEWSEEDTEMYINVASSLRGYACGLENEEHKRHIKKELDWLENRFQSLRPSWKPAESDAIKGGDFISDGKRVFLVLANAKERNLGETDSTFCESHILGVDGVVYCDGDNFKKFKRATSDERAKFIHDLKVGVKLKEQPAEWSEEDKHCIHQLILFCENCMQQDSEAIRCATWLKSLRPQSHWKPSEEQMEAIENVIKCELSAGLHTRANILQTLQNELKKL